MLKKSCRESLFSLCWCTAASFVQSTNELWKQLQKWKETQLKKVRIVIHWIRHCRTAASSIRLTNSDLIIPAWVDHGTAALRWQEINGTQSWPGILESLPILYSFFPTWRHSTNYDEQVAMPTPAIHFWLQIRSLETKKCFVFFALYDLMWFSEL